MGRCAVAATPIPANASFHLWDVKEIYSNFDGSVQFVELFTLSNDQNALAGHTLSSLSNGIANKVFTFPGGVGGDTATMHVLIATPGFAALPGAPVPDFSTLPQQFFDVAAAQVTINFSGVDSITVSSAIIPLDGVKSLTDASAGQASTTFTTGPNSPTSLVDGSGAIMLAPGPTLAADFTMNGAVNQSDLNSWRNGFGQVVGAAHPQGDADEDGDVDGADYLIWQRQLGNPPPPTSGAAAFVPEPAGPIAAAWALWFVACSQRSPRLLRVLGRRVWNLP